MSIVKFSCLALITGLFVFAVSANGAPRDTPFVLRDDDVVVFLGGTNMVHLVQSGHLEARWTLAFATARPKFRDLSWEADTVFEQGTVIERWRRDGFGALHEQFSRVGATVVVAQFGGLESLAGREGLKEFAAVYEKFIQDLPDDIRTVVLISPTPFEPPSSSLVPNLTKRNADLKLYVQATAEVAGRHDLYFVDLFTNAPSRLTSNGMQVRADAQATIAHEICKQIDIPPVDDSDIDALREAVVEKHRLWYDYWRPANWKLLFGDDSQRQFTRGGEDYIPFREEWQQLIPLIKQAEERVWQIAAGEGDPGPYRRQQEVLHGDPSADVASELASFTTLDDLQVNLFASEEHGLTSPLAIRWDPAGRMYVTVTTTYPHVFPGDDPSDKVIVLEDTDHDGVADKSTVFADGLNIPTGLEWGDGGVYVGQNTQLLFLKDTDGDGVADERHVLLSGFGNGDSHQTINSFVWSPGGELFFGQGDGCESRVETPWGASNLFQAGFYRLRPKRLQLHPLLDDFMGPGNPWGVAFDDWGQIFSIDGAGGVTFLSPGQVPTTHRLRLRTIGEPGGYCGIGYLDGRHLPESLRGSFVVGDFKGHQIKRFTVEPEGAGFKLHWQEPILHSRHRNFRPVDVKVGPDGAIYVVDWYNPITCHQDDAYRDPTRDKAHGRIWRISSKSALPIEPPSLSGAPLQDVLDALKAPVRWTRYQAKRELTVRDVSYVAAALQEWVAALDPQHAEYEQHLVQALGAYATVELVEPALLMQVANAKDHRARAYAARIAGRWHDRMDAPLNLLKQLVNDAHPQVRLEAVMACAAIALPEAMVVAAEATDQPMDEWVEYAFTQTVHHLRPHWLPAFQRGDIAFGRPEHVAAVLNIVGGAEVLSGLKQTVETHPVASEVRRNAIAAILAAGDGTDWREYGLDPARFTQSRQYDVAAHADALERLVEVATLRRVAPAGDWQPLLRDLIESPHEVLQSHALALAGLWNASSLAEVVSDVAQDASLPTVVRGAAFGTMVDLQIENAEPSLVSFSAPSHEVALRAAAVEALARLNVRAAANRAAQLLVDAELSPSSVKRLIVALLGVRGGGEALAAELDAQDLPPDRAKQLLQAFFETGLSSQPLFAALNSAIGGGITTPQYSEAVVRQLARDSESQGDAGRGRQLLASMACVSCHKVAGGGGDIGPDLTSVGTTLSRQRIIEELLWPNRQVKEGFSVLRVFTSEGLVMQGLPQATRHHESHDDESRGEVVIKEVSSGRIIRIPKEDVEETHFAGSPMPDGLTSALSRSQLLDLIEYLSQLGMIE